MRGLIFTRSYFLSHIRTPRSICQTQTISRIKDRISTFRKGPLGSCGCSAPVNKNLAPYTKGIAYVAVTNIDSKQIIEKSHTNSNELTVKGKLLQVFAEYGVVGVVTYTLTGFFTLGFSYATVSYGVDVVGILEWMNLEWWLGDISNMKMLAGMTTFVVAYAFHQVFLPLRIIATVGLTPLITRKLRCLGIIKAKKVC